MWCILPDDHGQTDNEVAWGSPSDWDLRRRVYLRLSTYLGGAFWRAPSPDLWLRPSVYFGAVAELMASLGTMNHHTSLSPTVKWVSRTISSFTQVCPLCATVWTTLGWSSPMGDVVAVHNTERIPWPSNVSFQRVPCHHCFSSDHHLPGTPRSLESATHMFVQLDCHHSPLNSPYHGLYVILDHSDKTVTIPLHGKPEVLSIGRVKPADLPWSDSAQNLPETPPSVTLPLVTWLTPSWTPVLPPPVIKPLATPPTPLPVKNNVVTCSGHSVVVPACFCWRGSYVATYMILWSWTWWPFHSSCYMSFLELSSCDVQLTHMTFYFGVLMLVHFLPHSL